MQPLAPHLAGREMLEQHAGADTALAGIVAHGDVQQARHLLRLGEIMLRGLGQPRAFQRHDALIALAGHRLIEGDGEIALAKQAEQARVFAKLGEPVRIELRIAAHGARLVVGDEQRDDALLGLRLQGELAGIVLEQGAQQAGEHQRLGDQLLDHRRIGMGREHVIKRRAQAHETAPDIAVGNGEAKRFVGEATGERISHGR